MAMTNSIRHALCALALAVGLAGCADIPEEAVTLSVTVGRDLGEVHRSHKALAERYFGRIRKDVNAFIDETYAPFIVERVLTVEKTVTKPDGTKLTIPAVWKVLSAEVEKPGGGAIVQRMTDTVKKLTDQIEKKRAEYLSPIEEQEIEVMRSIDDAYAKIQNAHAVVTGHLASIRKVQQAQEELLGAVGLKDVRRKVIDTAANLSDKIADITEKARRGEQAIDNAVADVKDAITTAKQTIDKLKADADKAPAR